MFAPGSRLVALVFTDIVGSTALKHALGDRAGVTLIQQHHQLVREILARLPAAEEIVAAGDSFLLMFHRPSEAVQFALQFQSRLRQFNAGKRLPLEDRIGIHLGEVVVQESGAGEKPIDLQGIAVDTCARVMSLARGGQILLTRAVFDSARQMLKGEDIEGVGALTWVSHGRYLLKGVEEPVEICEVAESGQSLLRPPDTTEKARRHTLPDEEPVLGWRPAVGQPVGRTGEAKSVAVLAFVNLSADKADEYLSDGISEEIIAALSKLKGLRVPARTSCFAFKGKHGDIRRIGEQLGVRTVLDGSVTKSGNKLRVTAQLINIADGFHLWSETYDRALDDLLAIRTDVAERVVEALKGQLLGEDRQKLTKQTTANAEAYLLYIQGRYLWNRRTGESLKKAADCFEQAVAKDPNYAPAYAALADCYLVVPDYAFRPAKQWMPKAAAAALRALELDSTLGEAHAALGLIKMYFDWDWPGAEAEFKRAIALNPDCATAHHWYSIWLRNLGRFDEASREIRQAQDVDPLSPVIGWNVGEVLLFNRQYEPAIAQYRKVIELEPHFAHAHAGLGFAHTMTGAFGEAIADFQTLRSLVGSSPRGLGGLGYTYAVSGSTSEARKVLDDLMGFLLQGYDVQLGVAAVYCGLGDREQALAWLEQGLEARVPTIHEMKTSPLWDSLRSEPKFIALLKKIGLQK